MGRRRAAAAAAAALAAAFTLAGARPMMAQQAGKATGSQSIEEVIGAWTERLLAVPGVVGIAEGRCEGSPCIRVLVEHKGPEIDRQVPAEIQGYPVTVVETGTIRPLARPDSAPSCGTTQSM